MADHRREPYPLLVPCACVVSMHEYVALTRCGIGQRVHSLQTKKGRGRDGFWVFCSKLSTKGSIPKGRLVNAQSATKPLAFLRALVQRIEKKGRGLVDAEEWCIL